MRIKLYYVLPLFVLPVISSAQVRLIGFQTLPGQSTSNIIEWQADAPESLSTNATDVNSIIIANSTFNASTGDFIAKVNVNNASGILEFNTLNNNLEFNGATITTNGSSECDMQTGFVYSYDNNAVNQKVLKRYDPATNNDDIVGTFNFPENALFYPDSSCFDSNLGIYYFVMSDSDGLKLVSVPVNNADFTYSQVSITGLPILGNIGLEFSNDSNTIFATFATDFNNGQNYVFNVGKISPQGVVESLMAMPSITSTQFYNRTFDQTTNAMIFVASDQSDTMLFVYDTDTNTYAIKQLPEGNLYEIESNNYTYSVAKYGQLGVDKTEPSSQIVVNQNLKTILFPETMAGQHFDLFTITGAKVASSKVSTDLSFNYSQFQSGIYIIKIDGAKQKTTRKLSL
ncbi:T9SS type A sorting domain-containing protein [Flavobacterium sp.]|uniref:T9SS type A sorting domain-containing protein n=1 Tax=Flavobacterium sp. TaxID=239 RepID=UPI00260F08A7|nr:T9SS type A sorting domain-containing protein [Flavobacterium sp.]